MRTRSGYNFLRFRDSRIDGTPVEVGRIGMTHNLAYELHGPMEDGPKIYDSVVRGLTASCSRPARQS